jgi:Holliday junction DNA helicase RuvA
MICKILYKSATLVEPNTYELETSSGVFFEVFSPNKFSDVAEGEGTAYIYHHINERTQVLYGFSTKGDKALFEDLISVEGIGPSMALKLMSSYSADKIKIDIADGDLEDLSKAKGIGKKTAEKIIHSLKDKYTDSSTKGILTKKEGSDYLILSKDLAVKALIKLGYQTKDAQSRVNVASETILSENKNLFTALHSHPQFNPNSVSEMVPKIVSLALQG